MAGMRIRETEALFRRMIFALDQRQQAIELLLIRVGKLLEKDGF